MPYITKWSSTNKSMKCADCGSEKGFMVRIWESNKDQQILQPPKIRNLEYKCDVCGVTWTKDIGTDNEI
jgi:hypothetical protein